MQAFEFYCPTKIYFGKGAEARVGEAVKHFGGTKVFIVYGGHSAVKSGLIARIEQTLTDAGLEHMSFGGVQPNPRLSHAREGVQKALAFGADFILGVGGGSVMDTSKAIAHGVANPETDIWDFWSKKAALTKTSKLGAVLTISAAGSETSDSAVLTNDETTLKRGLNTDLQRPLFAIMDPELTYTLPRYQVGCGVVDIMMHTLERYFNPGHPSNRMTDEIAEGLLRTVIDAGRVAMQDSHNYDAMSEIMWAGSLSHNNLTGLGGVKDFSVHQFGHELSGMLDAAHGATLSVMWPQWARYVVDTDPARFAHYGEAVWRLTRKDGESDRDLALRAIDTTEEFFRSIDMPTTFTELGIGVLSEEQLRELAERCTFFHTRVVGKFCPLDYDGILAVYRMANKYTALRKACRPARLSLYLPFQNAQKPALEDLPARGDELCLDLGLEPFGLFLCRGSLTLALPLELFLLGLGGPLRPPARLVLQLLCAAALLIL